jgi:hypothetical protein
MQNTNQNQNQNQDQPDYSKMSLAELVLHYTMTRNPDSVSISAIELEIINQLFRKITANYPQLPREYVGDNLNTTIVVNSMLAAMFCNMPKKFIAALCQENPLKYSGIVALQGMGKHVNYYMQKQYGTTCPKVSVDNTGPGVDLTDPKSQLDRN